MFVDKILYKSEEYTRIYKGSELIAEIPISMEEGLTIYGAKSISVVDNGTATHNLEYYDTSVGSWSPLTDTITPKGKVYLRGNIHTTSATNFCQIKVVSYSNPPIKSNVHIGGNLGSINGGHRVCTLDTKFISLFSGNKDIVVGGTQYAPNLILPYMSGIGGVYERLFFGVKFGNPVIPADIFSTTGVAAGAFNSAFRESNITKSPKLPVSRIIPKTCYANMFNKCTALTDISNIDLSADEIGQSGCLQMFISCSSLTAAPELPCLNLGNECYSCMFKDCKSLVTAPVLPATTLAAKCYLSMFSGCSNLTTAPVLPATTLITYCYWHLFVGCSKLNYVKCLAEDISAEKCTEDWLYNAPSAGTFVKSANMAGWTTGTSGIPTGWTVEDV